MFRHLETTKFIYFELVSMEMQKQVALIHVPMEYQWKGCKLWRLIGHGIEEPDVKW